MNQDYFQIRLIQFRDQTARFASAIRENPDGLTHSDLLEKYGVYDPRACARAALTKYDCDVLVMLRAIYTADRSYFYESFYQARYYLNSDGKMVERIDFDR